MAVRWAYRLAVTTVCLWARWWWARSTVARMASMTAVRWVDLWADCSAASADSMVRPTAGKKAHRWAALRGMQKVGRSDSPLVFHY